MGVKIGRVEREYIGRKLKPRHGRLRDRHLGLLQLKLADLLSDPMKGLPRESRTRQARHARQTGIKKLSEITFGSWRACPLNGHSHHQLAHRRTILGTDPGAGSINVRDQIELFGHPDQRADITQCARAHRARGTQVGQRRRSDRPQHDLARDRATRHGVPHRLRRDAVPTSADFSFEYVHVPSCSIFEVKSKHKPSICELGRAANRKFEIRIAKVGLALPITHKYLNLYPAA